MAKKSGNIYVDLLENVKFVPKNLRLNRMKNNSLSSLARLKGNEKFYQNDYDGALSLYNESICLAESGSNHLSLGYANRSNCFLKMQRYDQCLLDIKLAEDAGYPENLMVKLLARKRECQKQLQSSCQSTESSSIPTLPWISTSIQRSEDTGKGFTAIEDIEVGQTLIVEESYVHMMHSDETNYCGSCWKRNMNFVPCKNCADTMYCSQKCADNNFHEVECDMAFHFEDHIDGYSSIFILRSVIIGINTFANIDEMMQFIEKCMSTNRFVHEPYETSKEQYRTFFKLPCISSQQRIENLRQKCWIIFDAIMKSKLANKFQTKFKPIPRPCDRSSHHILTMRSNSFMGSMHHDDEKRFAQKPRQKLDLMTSYFGHSCLPNITSSIWIKEGQLSSKQFYP